ncbi:scavenger receptor class F member 1 [Kryptolebias marmoratus]|uniref:scavenger receptor class F member 1 n=1 Tax=Kryptolebias marmoratus TaxID=37003 RepID=UPI0007F874ED|nr:scavenger receptor class F member 1 [Kryptolebias marmoratus]
MKFLPVLCCLLSSAHALDPGGRNVCHSSRDPSTPVCCTGWRQQGDECTAPVCEGEQACLENEICLLPGVCRCPPGYYGAQCKTRCPPEFWAPDCRRVCPCFPHGRCHPATGECTCVSTRWGPLCQNTCKCARLGHGHCHPVYGNCTCDRGWTLPTCSRPCYCSDGGSEDAGCDQLTGRCRCRQGSWGVQCSSKCNCNLSPCNQWTGVCECVAGWWGTGCDRMCTCDLTHSSCDPVTGQCVCHPGYKGFQCDRPCEAGRYGSGCNISCGHCKDQRPCSAADGACGACEPGWNGTLCDHQCPSGFYGDGCKEKCPRCRKDETCDPRAGTCGRCEPGWTGPRCEEPCPGGTHGDACSFLCGPCFHGNCHPVTGRCVCRPGFQGESCNDSCPALQFGLNCSSPCDCGDGVGCHPVTGACPNSGRGAVLAGVLVPLFLLVFAVLCCCLCCGGRPAASKDRAAVADGGLSVRMKYHVYSVLANIGAALPCISDWSSGLPRVTVSHHDPELTFNHSFIEPPSSGWVTEGSSFDSDEEEGEALYCVPPREDILEVAGGEFQEMSSKCNMFLDPSGFSSEDIASPFNIPRTSSIAKSKRPSVSFAEGTRFSPKERRGSAQDIGAPLRSKAKSPWGVLMLSALQSQGGAVRTGDGGGAEGEEEEEEEEDGADDQVTDNRESRWEDEAQEVDRSQPQEAVQAPGSSGRRRTMSNAAARKGTSDGEAGPPRKVTTVYVTVGKAGRPVTKTDPSSEGPVQAMLRRLGSLQRQREQEPSKPRPKAAEGVAKPPRKKLGARVAVWEQGGPSGVCKPIRRKHASHNPADASGPDQAAPPEENAQRRPPSSILKSRLEVAAADSGSDPRGEGGEGPTEICYQTAGAPGDAAQIIANERALVNATDEPCYENILIK